MAVKFDPLEAAKLAPSAKKTKVQDDGPVPTQPAVPGADPALAPTVEQAPVPGVAAKVDIVPTAAVAAHHGQFRVRVTKIVSWYGQITTLPAGSVVSYESYGGAVGIERLVSQGVLLDPIT